MTKTALLIEMIDVLQNHPGIDIKELAAAVGRSERTVYRWLSELSSDIHAPIYCNDGGYYLLNREGTTKLHLAPEELLAVRLSLKSAPFAEGSPIKKHAESAWLKIRDASSWEQLQSASEISDSFAINVTAPEGNVRPELIETLEKAVASHHRMDIVYRSQKSNRIKEYSIEPYAIVFRRHSWYMVAFCLEHNKIVQFKVVRIRNAIDTGIDFELPKDFTLEDYYKFSWEAWAGGEPTKVRIRFSPDVAEMVSETKRHPTQVVYHESDGGIIFEATVAGIEEIAIWLMGFGGDAKVLEPNSLRDLMLDRARGILDQYSSVKEKFEKVQVN